MWLASTGYFDALRLRVLSGRTFTDRDTPAGGPVAVVNETFARAVFGGDPAVGRQLRLPPLETPLDVIGVVADIREVGLSGAERRGAVYLSVHQPYAAGAFGGAGLPEAPFVAVRTTRDPGTVIPFLREAVADVNPYARIDDVQTLDARMSASVASPRFHLLLSGAYAALALLLAAAGIYGLLSYTVSERRREIGLRMALGARSGNIVVLVVGRVTVLVAAGIVVGLAGAAAATRILESLLFGVTTGDGLTLIASPVVLAAVALLACYLPARRASRVDPTDTLRVE